MENNLTYEQRKQIAKSFIKEINEYHKQMLKCATEDIAKTTHTIANRNLLEAYKWVCRGKTTPWRKECYKEDL